MPMEFRKLLDGVSLADEMRHAIERILEDKLAGREMDDGPRIRVFHEFFDQEIPRLESIAQSIPRGPTPDPDLLDQAFRRMIG